MVPLSKQQASELAALQLLCGVVAQNGTLNDVRRYFAKLLGLCDKMGNLEAKAEAMMLFARASEDMEDYSAAMKL